MAASVGSVTFEVVLRAKRSGDEHVVGEVTVPVRAGSEVHPDDVSDAVAALGRRIPRTRRGRRSQARAGVIR